jgi:hypothetical protein
MRSYRALDAKRFYDPRRLRLHGLIERMPQSNRYRVTPEGIRIAFFFTRAHAPFFSTALSLQPPPLAPNRGTRALVQASQAVDRLIAEVKLAA